MKITQILTLITALLSGGGLAADSAQVTSPVSLTGEKAVAQLKESGQYDSIAAAYEAARHAVRADEAEPDGVLHAQNPGHGLSASFDRHGLQLSVQRHGSEGERLTTRWRLDSVGRDGAVEKVPAGDALRRDGQRAEIVRAGLGLTEWFVNRPSGLEHGFTLDRRPAGAGALRLDIAIEGDLSPVPGADGQRIELHDAAGAKVLDYDTLRVWDAAGQELPARMEQSPAGGLRFRVEDAGARYPLTVDPTFTQQAYLKASNAGAGDNFGVSVAVSGDTVVVGAPSEDGNAASTTATPNESAADAGAAYVFVRSGSTWTQQAYLKASNAGAGDRFGCSVAVSGDTVVVGASDEDSSMTGINSPPNEGAAKAGAAYVFVRSGSTWTQQAYLKPAAVGTNQENDFFGSKVAVSGDTVVVGAYKEDSSTTVINSPPNESAAHAGAAYVFVRSGSTWTQQAYLKASNAGAGDAFGVSVAVSGDTVVVGAYFEDSSTTVINSPPNESAADAGAAYVFVRSGTNWSQQAYLKPVNAAADYWFGYSVAVSGDTVAVGSPQDSSVAPGGGGFYIYVRSGTNWSEEYAKGFAVAGARAGESMAISGDTFAVGIPLYTAGVGAMFVRSGTNWTPQAELNASNAGAGDAFGVSVAVSGDTVVVGAYKEDSSTTGINTTPNESAADAGAAYVFSLIPDPTLTSVSPTSGPIAGGTTVTLTGTNFTGATGVTFGGTAATSLTVNSATSITCTTPAGTAGTASVRVTTPAGTNAANTLFTYVAPPTLTSVSPNSGTTAGGTLVTLTGTGFTGATSVFFGGTGPAATNVVVVNATTITCNTPARAASARSVAVTTPAGTSGAQTYTFVDPTSPPTLTSVSPNSGTTAGGTTVTLTGTNFTGATGVTFGGTAATSLTVNSATSITCTTPAGTAGAKSVLVTTPGGTNAANTLFTYVVPPSPPTLTSLTPNSGSTAGGLLVTLTGTNFTGATGVTFGGTAATSVVVVNATSITCTTPAGTAGARSVLVTTPGGTNAANTLFTYVVPPPTPTLTSLTPPTGSTAGGTMVTLTGTNFTGATGVTFGGTAATALNVVNATTITCTTPAGTAGTASVRVTTPGGMNGANTLFTYVVPPPAPTLTSVSPNSGTTAGGTVVTLTGTNFTGATGVTFGGTAATSVIVVNATTITCTTPARAAGTASVLVTTPGGTNAANTLYTYVVPPSPPTLTSVSPPTGSTAGGTSVTLTGTNFTGATGVTIGGAAATSVNVVSATTITCTTPAGTAGARSVLVTTPGGTNAVNTLFTYGTPPTVTLATANLLSNVTSLTIAGTNFSTTPGQNTVVFTPTGTGTVTASTATSLTVTSLSGLTLGALNAVVTTNGLSSGAAVQVRTVVAPGPGDPDPLNLNIGGSHVYATAVQPDGKTIIAGIFSSVLGQTRNNIARLNADGTLDPGFNPNANSNVLNVAVQADGKILLGGQFTTVGGQTRNNIARLNADGTLDPGFNPNANGDVRSLALQADGKILLGGTFTTVGGQTRNRIARLNSDGTLDTGFNPNANGDVYGVAVQADGKILLGGAFTTVGGQTRNRIARLNADGTLDTGFNPGANSWAVIAVQADGKILLGGQFTTVGGQTRNRIARLNADGTLDTGFNPDASSTVYSVAVQADGKILLGGTFTTVGDQTRNRIARLDAAGTLDTGFNPDASNDVYSVAVQADGKILLGGLFTTVGGQARNRFARVLNSPATQSLSIPNASRVQWLRGGASPEVEPVTFELSTDGGTSYSVLGTGTRLSGGWERTGLSLPASGHIRARGRTTGSYNTSSSGLVETVASFSGLVAASPVTVTSISPATGSTAGGTSVTITGTNFTGTTGVTIGGAAATSVNVVSATSITCTTPAGTAGARSIIVRTTESSNAANTLFTYVVAPPFSITAFSYNPTARTVNLTFLSEPAVNYTLETSPNGQTWTTLGAQVPGAAAATSTTVTGRPLQPPYTDRLLLRVRRP